VVAAHQNLNSLRDLTRDGLPVIAWPLVYSNQNLLHPQPKVMVDYVFTHFSRYIGRLVNNFMAPFQVRLSSNLSVIPLATGDEVLKFWKVKAGGGGMRSMERPSSMACFNTFLCQLLTTIFTIAALS